MPINILRLNPPGPQPSNQIVFIKPLPGPTETYAQDFLERIAAICHPIMKANHLSITTLEEHEPNREFIGRNFNAGEIVQLVLRSRESGRWLSFRNVQMVMMHELAHCIEMNHGRGFWKVNNQYKGELRELWKKGYTGDGLWGKGQTLLSGEYDTGRSLAGEEMPRSLCGGTYRTRRRRKRKRDTKRPKETYADMKERRIRKKFGINGMALGDDDETKGRFENGKKPQGKPRVAQSKRGRELRAAAALARFDQAKNAELKEAKEIFDSSDTENGSDSNLKDVIFDTDGSQLRDGDGQGMVRVCGDEDQEDAQIKQEMEDLATLDDPNLASSQQETEPNSPSAVSAANSVARSNQAPHSRQTVMDEMAGDTHPTPDPWGPRIRMEDVPLYVEPAGQPTGKRNRSGTSQQDRPNPESAIGLTSSSSRHGSDQNCPICSMANEVGSFLCIACSHVLDTSKVTRYWRCRSDICKDNQYLNAADCRICGVCGTRNDITT